MYNVAYATGSRADYGIVRRYLQKLDNDAEIDLSILVTGSHLDSRFGYSVHNIESDGFKIGLRVPLSIDNSTTSGVVHSMSIALYEFGNFFERTKYDLLIILGDRYEMMAVATAAAMQRIPILHLHGGESTYGNYDEFFRHCITKMSTYHFASTEEYKKRIIQMGESPDRVFNLGALGAENCMLIHVDNVDEQIKMLPEKKYFVIVFHPETLTDDSPAEQVTELLKALDQINDYSFVFMGTNADTGSGIIRSAWLSYIEDHKNCFYFENISNDSYLYLLKNSVALIGNSSSGIIEAPSLGVYTINIGHRQDGRVRGNSVFSSECLEKEILKSINKVLSSTKGDFPFENPYYSPNTVVKYYRKTKELLAVNNNEIRKTFYDVKF